MAIPLTQIFYFWYHCKIISHIRHHTTFFLGLPTPLATLGGFMVLGFLTSIIVALAKDTRGALTFGDDSGFNIYLFHFRKLKEGILQPF
jgi:hypothetical protein